MKSLEKSFSMLADTMPGIVFRRIMTRAGKISYPYLSRGMRNILQTEDTTLPLTAEGCIAIVHWADRRPLMDLIRSSALSLKPYIEEFRIVTPSGEVRWLRGNVNPSALEDGSVEWAGILIDITEAKKNEQRLDMLLEYAPDGLIMLDSEGRIELSNRSVERIFGYGREETKGLFLADLLAPEERGRFTRQLEGGQLVEDGEMAAAPQEKTGVCKDGRLVPIEISLSTVKSEGKISFVGVLRDVTERKKDQERLYYYAYSDPVTGLKNKTWLMLNFPNLLIHAQGNGQLLSVITLAPAHLAQVQAVAGHKTSDLLLAQIARKLQSFLGPDDVASFLGGDRFVILLGNLKHSLEADRILDRMLLAFSSPFSIDGQEFDVTPCIGVCFFPTDGEDPTNLLRHSSLALDKAIEKGKGSVSVFTEEMNIEIASRLSIRTRLRKGLDKDEIITYFQPQVSVSTGEIIGMEALARWNMEGEIKMPGYFISVAEEYGLIEEITDKVLKETCRWNKKWVDAGLSHFPIAVNVPGTELQNHRKFLKKIQTALSNSSLPAQFLQLELTESSAMEDPDGARDVFNQLLKMGISCSIDDFGTGYSSLSLLKNFPLKTLKIDRSFIIELNNEQNLKIVKATIAMAHALGLSALAEGVETREHFDILKRLRCDAIQGYLFSRPLPPEKAEEFLKSWSPSILTDRA